VAVNLCADYIAATGELPQLTGVEDAVRVVVGLAKAVEPRFVQMLV
jgi:hypothetical protein